VFTAGVVVAIATTVLGVTLRPFDPSNTEFTLGTGTDGDLDELNYSDYPEPRSTDFEVLGCRYSDEKQCKTHGMFY